MDYLPLTGEIGGVEIKHMLISFLCSSFIVEEGGEEERGHSVSHEMYTWISSGCSWGSVRGKASPPVLEVSA